MILALTNAALSRYLCSGGDSQLTIHAVRLIEEYVRLSTDLEADTLGGGLGVVDGLCARLDVVGDAVVVARGEGAEVAEAVEGHRVLGSAEASGSGVARDLALLNVVRRLSTEEEAIAANDGVSGEGGTLRQEMVRRRNAAI